MTSPVTFGFRNHFSMELRRATLIGCTHQTQRVKEMNPSFHHSPEITPRRKVTQEPALNKLLCSFDTVIHTSCIWKKKGLCQGWNRSKLRKVASPDGPNRVFLSFRCSLMQTFCMVVSRGHHYWFVLGHRALGLKAWSVVRKSYQVKAFFLHSLPLRIAQEDVNCDWYSEGVRGDPLYNVKMAWWKAEFTFSKQNLHEGLQWKGQPRSHLTVYYIIFTQHDIYWLYFSNLFSNIFSLIYQTIYEWIYL